MVISRFLLRTMLGVSYLVISFPAFGQSFAPPEGGWAYTFEGADAEASDDPFLSLDGTWDHNNGSDQWDGSAIGDGNPGGISALMDGDTTFIRIQDPGDPRDYGLSDPGSNRKVYVTHNLAGDFEEAPDNLATIIDDGVTLYFRTRVATAETGDIDEWHPDGGGGIADWPAEGVGYHQHNSGKSMIAIKQTDGANVAFGLNYGETVNADLFESNGLILPHLLIGTDLAGEGGTGLSTAAEDSDADRDTSDFWSDAQTDGQIVVAEDVTAWQEYWVTIQSGSLEVDGFEDGTHEVNIFTDGADDPTSAMQFFITAAQGTDYRDGDEQSYIALGAGATGREGAFDIDFFSWAPGVHSPMMATGGGCEPLNSLTGDLDGDGSVAFGDFLILSSNFGTATDSYENGDIDCNGSVEFADFLALSANFGQSLPAGAQAVPEPSSLILLLPAIALLVFRKRR